MSNISVSVIIPSYNGAHRISKLLAALENQDRSDFETILVIDGSTDNTLDIIRNTDWSLDIKILEQQNKGRAGARNAGAKIATAELLIFYDDDVIPEPNSISLHLTELENYPITVGQQLETQTATTEFGKYKAAISRQWLSGLGEEPMVLDQTNIFLTAANMGVSKPVFDHLNGFDPELSDAEDFDFAVRAFTQGYAIRYIPKNKVTHLSFDSFKAYILRQREYRKAQADLIQLRHNHKNRNLYQKYTVSRSLTNRIAYFFIPGIAVSAIDRGILKILPLKLRHFIYPRVISALSVYYPNRKL